MPTRIGLTQHQAICNYHFKIRIRQINGENALVC